MEKQKKKTKIQDVKDHLKRLGKITTWDSYKLYGVTRISTIIYILRKRGWNIKSVQKSKLDRNKNMCNFVEYVYTES